MLKQSIIVRAQWDPEAAVWVATSGDVPGLVTEADDLDQLLGKVRVMVPELLDLDPPLRAEFPAEVPVILVTERIETIRLNAA